MVQGKIEDPGFTIRGTVPLAHLMVDVGILSSCGPLLAVRSGIREVYRTGITVYNFEVEDDHTYFVGSANSGIWVHNEGLCFIDPAEIRFTQANISENFSQNGTVKKLIERLKSDPSYASKIPPIRHVRDEAGVLHSLDNRRLYAFKQAGVPVPYVMATPEEVDKAFRSGRGFKGDAGKQIIIRGRR